MLRPVYKLRYREKGEGRSLQVITEILGGRGCLAKLIQYYIGVVQQMIVVSK